MVVDPKRGVKAERKTFFPLEYRKESVQLPLTVSCVRVGVTMEYKIWVEDDVFILYLTIVYFSFEQEEKREIVINNIIDICFGILKIYKYLIINLIIYFQCC